MLDGEEKRTSLIYWNNLHKMYIVTEIVFIDYIPKREDSVQW